MTAPELAGLVPKAPVPKTWDPAYRPLRPGVPEVSEKMDFLVLQELRELTSMTLGTRSAGRDATTAARWSQGKVWRQTRPSFLHRIMESLIQKKPSPGIREVSSLYRRFSWFQITRLNTGFNRPKIGDSPENPASSLGVHRATVQHDLKPLQMPKP